MWQHLKPMTVEQVKDFLDEKCSNVISTGCGENQTN